MSEFASKIDRLTRASGQALAWLSALLASIVTLSIVSRSIFATPLPWAYDMSYMLCAAIFMLGAALALLEEAHVRTDLFWNDFSIRTKSFIDLLFFVALFIPVVTVLAIVGFKEVVHAFRIGETADQSSWRPLLWPFKALIPLSFALLLLQGVSEIIKRIEVLRGGEVAAPVKKEINS